MKAIIMAGGTGSRLLPLTLAINKHLLPIYDKPMIYYPISLLMLAGVKEILLIIKSDSLKQFKLLLGNGDELGIKINYKVQDAPLGIADGIKISENFIRNERFIFALGDNIFYGDSIGLLVKDAYKNSSRGVVFSCWNSKPEDYGVLQRDSKKSPLNIIEKPTEYISNEIITGLYIYDSSVIDIVNSLRPSQRGELEISDLNDKLLKQKELAVVQLGRGVAWFDNGSALSMLHASNFVEIIQNKQGKLIGSVEEIALNLGLIEYSAYKSRISKFHKSNYAEYHLE